MISLVLITLLSALMGFLLCIPVFRWLVARNIIDKPNERSSHDKPVARGGGIAIMAVIVVGAAAIQSWHPTRALPVLICASMVIAVMSFYDDLHSMPPAVRFIGHALAALAVVAALGWPHMILEWGPNRIWVLPTLTGWGLMFLWLAGYTNAFNFMDGINGIAGCQALLTGLGSALLAGLATERWLDAPLIVSVLVAGAAAGFLPHNFPQARMFMGDVSSAPLGLLLASLTLWLSSRYGWWLLPPLALLHANFVLDTSITLARRMLRGEQWYGAHREHFYQRLIRSGKSHAYVTGCEIALQLAALALLLGYGRMGLEKRLASVGAILAMWLLFFLYCERAFRRAQRAAAQ